MTSLAVLGSTGSIGTQTLDVVRARPDRYTVRVLGAFASADRIVEQAEEFRPELVVLIDEAAAAAAAPRLPRGTELWVGAEALAEAAKRCDIVVNAVVGFAGLGVTLSTLRAGRRLALANKESLVAGGPVVRAVSSTPGAQLIPVDSEHSALHQCLRAGGGDAEVARLLLTASGGPFRTTPPEELATITVEQALSHPTWRMGPKITVDSSTLMNKGLEVIEAKELFDIEVDRIDVVVHPQSIVHSMVTFTDGSTMAQLSRPDMRLPIAYALAYPDRFDHAYGALDWTSASTLSFEPPDHDRFPCLGLAYQASRTGGTAPAWLNGANEAVVAAFLEGRIPWIGIAEVLKAVMDRHDGGKAETVDDVVEADRTARRLAVEVLNSSGVPHDN
ncbi:MAG: 1-deoxy-D-xylulose-5-phosphate reductoisomerase [Acidimicrobiales bacterium]|nr:1-deoxy-D-xylulose-5-phosphate reductoisomerase [Acidimicrobiales bacterium]